MSVRWKMNRMGFVNFWLYDEESFDFENGRLLLRGQNGSGKSITTQSFIPFILDGDRTPSRLDPFGSSDRRMEYYFLGEDGKNESTGYLFLEFYKEETGQYRTIAIGQRARRGKPMDFWGFVINDNRRIGVDLHLYREVGSSKIPCTRQEIKKILGDYIPFAENPKDYKELVNKYIFGFRRLEQYDQFIRLLVKVRAPKLSKEFRPTKVYEILNESLQTLSDDDMRPMVDAMEKMDSIQENLEALRRALKDASALRVEYTRYNQYFLAKKAERFLDAAEQYRLLREEVDAMEQKAEKLRSDIQTFGDGEAQAKQEWNRADKELESLLELDNDLKVVASKLSNARKEEEAAAREEEEHTNRIQEYKSRILQADREIKNQEGNQELLEDQVDQAREELEGIQEDLQWDGHVLADSNHELYGPEEVLRQQLTLLNGYKERLRQAADTIRYHDQKCRDYDRQLQSLEEAKLQEDTLRIQIDQLLEEEEKEKERRIAELYTSNKQNRHLVMKPENLAEIEEMILAYSDMAQAEVISDIYQDVRNQIQNDMMRSQSQLAAQLKLLYEEEQKLAEELHAVESREEQEPERKKWKEDSRRMLERAGIPALPLFKALEFQEDLGEEDQSKIENILSEAGLLDALIIPSVYHERLLEHYPEFADAVISCPGGNRVESVEWEKLPIVVSPDMSDELKAEAERILPLLCKELLPDFSRGEYRHGFLYGRVQADGPAVLLGMEARIRQRQKLIARIREKIADNQELQREYKTRLYDLEMDMKLLQEEYDHRLSLKELNRILALIITQNAQLEVHRNHRMTLERIEEKAKNERNQAYQAMLSSCKEFPYERTITSYGEALDLAGIYASVCQNLMDHYRKLTMVVQELNYLREQIQTQEEYLDYEYLEQRKAEQRREGWAAQIRQYQDYLNQPERVESARRIRKLQEEMTRLQEQERSCHESLVQASTRLQSIEEQSGKKREEVELASVREQLLRDYYKEELALELIHKQESSDLLRNARLSLRYLRDGDKNKTEGEMTSALFEAFHRHSSNLTNYAVSLVDCFDEVDERAGGIRRRKRISLTWLGKVLYLEGFFKALNSAIEDTELLIQEKDRELFENILSQTISQQLTERIDESRRWVRAMSGLMKKMDTSMGLSFSLDWKGRSASEEEELDIQQLETLLLRNKELLTNADIEKVAKHFRSRVRDEKRKAEEAGMAVNYMDLVRDVLDYRKWFTFQMSYIKGAESKKPLTNAAFNRFSGGEKAMAMYVPLFAAVNAQYQKASKEDHPRMIALDEAFAGVDDKNIDSMFALVEKLDFDYIMNSQALWGCYESVKNLKITELIRPRNSMVVSLINYTWNGHEKVLDLQ